MVLHLREKKPIMILRKTTHAIRRFREIMEEKILPALADYLYLLHHIHVDDNGKEIIHHCLVYDHHANMFEQEHMVVKKGKAYVRGKQMKDGTYHVIKGLEPTQEVVWSDEDAKTAGITPKKMRHGMTLKQKSKEW